MCILSKGSRGSGGIDGPASKEREGPVEAERKKGGWKGTRKGITMILTTEQQL